MAGFIFRLEHRDGTPADPPTFRSSPGVTWSVGDTIPLGRDGILRVTEVRAAREPDGDPVLVVEAA